MTFKLGGEAGQGADTSGHGFAKALARAGLNLYGQQDYMSRIRGGHNFFQIRVSDRDVQASSDAVHLLMPLDALTVTEHIHEVVPGGAVIMDAPLKIDDSLLTSRGVKPVRVPLSEIAQREGGSKIMMNTASLAVAAGMTDLPFEYIEQVILDNFAGRKGSTVAEANIAVARAAYDEGAREFGPDFDFKLKPIPNKKPRMLING